MNTIKVFSPATIGNIGPGFDVLGLAIKGLGDIVEARKTKSGVRIKAIESTRPLPREASKNTAGIAALEVLKLLKVKGGVELEIKKGIPPGSGLGSSAASAAAAAFATNYLYGAKLSREELILPATMAEEAVSGGFFADNTAPALLGGATLSRPCPPLLDVIKIGSIDRLKLILITPEVKILTKNARKILPEEVPMKNFVANMANSCLITMAFAKNDYQLFARSLNDQVIEPVRSRLIKGFDKVKKNAIETGADGMTISGSGPTVFAITSSTRKAKLIEDAMLRTFREFGIKCTSLITEVEPRGTRIIK